MNNISFEDIVIIIGAAIPLLEVIVRMTPSEKDNSILNRVKRFYDRFFPNKKINGGSHK